MEARKECGDYAHEISKATGIHTNIVKSYLKKMNIEPLNMRRRLASEDEVFKIWEALKIHGRNYDRL